MLDEFEDNMNEFDDADDINEFEDEFREEVYDLDEATELVDDNIVDFNDKDFDEDDLEDLDDEID